VFWFVILFCFVLFYLFEESVAFFERIVVDSFVQRGQKESECLLFVAVNGGSAGSGF
jgi:hypothetical protein